MDLEYKIKDGRRVIARALHELEMDAFGIRDDLETGDASINDLGARIDEMQGIMNRIIGISVAVATMEEVIK